MLRDLRGADVDRFYGMLLRCFPEEARLVGFRSEPYRRVARRLLRWDLRLLLRLLERVHRPVVKALAVDVDGTLAAAVILSFSARAGFVSTLMVDAPFRRRGYARALMDRCRAETLRARRPYLALEVFSDNAPARALYANLGYRPLRAQSYYLRPEGPPPALDAGASRVVRPFLRRDSAALLPIAAGQLAPAVAEVLPATRGQFVAGEGGPRGFRSESQAWVVDAGAGPAGFVRATGPAVTEAANLSSPLLAPSVPEGSARALVATAVAWIASRARVRVVTLVPRGESAAARALTEVGFHEELAVETLYAPLDAPAA